MTTRKTSRPAQKSKAPAKALKGKAKVVSSKLSFQGRNFRVFTDVIVEPGGYKASRDIIRHHGSVVVLAADDSADPKIVLVRQYRHAAGQFLLELPAGHIDAGEPALKAAKRELGEETGFTAKKWTKLSRYYASPGFLGETMTVYLAQGLTEGAATPEDDENLELHKVPLSKLLAMIKAGKILDGKTIVGTMLFADSRRTTRK